MPVYQKAALEGPVAKDEYISATWTLTVIGMAVLFASFGLLMRPALQLSTPGFDDAKRALTVRIALLLLPAGVCTGLTGFQTALLNAQRLFVVPALATSLGAVGILFTVLAVGRTIGVLAIPYGALLGAVAGFAIVSIYARRKGVRLRLVSSFWTLNVRLTVLLVDA